MVWTDSQDYGADEILYTTGIVLIDKTGKLMREITTLFGVYPRLFLRNWRTPKLHELAARGGCVVVQGRDEARGCFIPEPRCRELQ
jgi:hypothetical protein